MSVDFSKVRQHPSASPVWRKRAVELAVEKGMLGRASKLHTVHLGVASYSIYECDSATEPWEHQLLYRHEEGAMLCDCEAGQRERPCSHAGAAFALLKDLAPAKGAHSGNA